MFKRICKLVRFSLDAVWIRVAPESWLRAHGVAFGKGCRFYGLKPGTFGSEPFLIRLGSRVTVTDGVRFVTHDGGLWAFRDKFQKLEFFSRITIGDNVFLGMNSIILPGVTLGDRVIVAAGSVVTKSWEGNAVIAGVPAQKICDADIYFEKKKLIASERAFGLKGKRRRRVIEELVDQRRRVDDS